MKNYPLVSVVIPAYNCENTVRETLESVLQQTYKNIEIIVVNDGSTDHSLDVISQYSGNVTIINKENGGVAGARNLGIKAAKGEFISFCDADDIWNSEKIEDQINYLNAHPQVDMVYCYWHVWQSNSTGSYDIPVSFGFSRKKSQQIDSELSGWIYHKLLLDCECLTSTVIMRRNLFNKIGYFDTSLKSGEDYDLWLRASRVTEIHKLKEVYVLYRAWPHSITRKPMKTHYEYEVLQRAVNRWGWVGPDGRKNSLKQNRQRIGKMRFDFGYLHVKTGDPKIAVRAFWEAGLKMPLWYAPWVYMIIALWKCI